MATHSSPQMRLKLISLLICEMKTKQTHRSLQVTAAELKLILCFLTSLFSLSFLDTSRQTHVLSRVHKFLHFYYTKESGEEGIYTYPPRATTCKHIH